MEFSNAQITKLLRQVAAAHQLKKAALFRIRAYENAADSIEHSTSEIKDLWEEGRLDQIPGIGESLKAHLEELFKTGEVKHWQNVKKGIPKIVFELLDIPGIGPKTAVKLADLNIESIGDLKDKIKSGELIERGFSGKIAEKILAGIEEVSSMEQGRMLLPYAFAQAEKVVLYLKKCPEVKKVHPLGSLRRMVATIGDLDFSIASTNPEKVIEHVISMPGIARVVEKGETQATVVLFSGLHLDFLIAEPNSYGALLQHFTGSKSHNIKLREFANHKGYSLSEYGVRKISEDRRLKVKDGNLIETKTEEEFYKILGMDTPPPEIREDIGEIEAAMKRSLPNLVQLSDIKGDFHLHSDFSLEPSHGPGVNSFDEIISKAEELGYNYVGISDHPPSIAGHSKEKIIEIIVKYVRAIDQLKSSHRNTRVLKLLEVDILTGGSLSVPNEGLKYLDFAIVGVHSSHKQPKKIMTQRILKALKNPFVKILAHPSGRLLNERTSYEVDWEVIFKFVAKNSKALEINAYPNRLDLPDNLIREAKSNGCKFIINTDSHSLEHMDNMRFGVAMARRGWLEAKDVINSWDLKSMLRWFNIKK